MHRITQIKGPITIRHKQPNKLTRMLIDCYDLNEWHQKYYLFACLVLPDPAYAEVHLCMYYHKKCCNIPMPVLSAALYHNITIMAHGSPHRDDNDNDATMIVMTILFAVY